MDRVLEPADARGPTRATDRESLLVHVARRRRTRHAHIAGALHVAPANSSPASRPRRDSCRTTHDSSVCSRGIGYRPDVTRRRLRRRRRRLGRPLHLDARRHRSHELVLSRRRHPRVGGGRRCRSTARPRARGRTACSCTTRSAADRRCAATSSTVSAIRRPSCGMPRPPTNTWSPRRPPRATDTFPARCISIGST